MNYLHRVNRRDEIIQNSLKLGSVYKMMDGVFGIVVFRYPGSDKTELMCRFMDCETVREACAELSEMFAGEFRPCDTDLAAWGRAIMHNRQSAILLTDN